MYGMYGILIKVTKTLHSNILKNYNIQSSI